MARGHVRFRLPEFYRYAGMAIRGSHKWWGAALKHDVGSKKPVEPNSRSLTASYS